MRNWPVPPPLSKPMLPPMLVSWQMPPTTPLKDFQSTTLSLPTLLLSKSALCLRKTPPLWITCPTAEKFKNLDPATFHNVNLAWTKQYQCNGTAMARAAALNATKNHTHANRTNITSTTCSANHTRELNDAAAQAAAAAASVLQTKLKTPVNAKPAVVKIEIQAWLAPVRLVRVLHL